MDKPFDGHTVGKRLQLAADLILNRAIELAPNADATDLANLVNVLGGLIEQFVTECGSGCTCDEEEPPVAMC